LRRQSLRREEGKGHCSGEVLSMDRRRRKKRRDRRRKRRDRKTRRRDKKWTTVVEKNLKK
jgi:hypothetical protein